MTDVRHSPIFEINVFEVITRELNEFFTGKQKSYLNWEVFTSSVCSLPRVGLRNLSRLRHL